MSDQPRPKRYIDLTLITQVPGDKPEAMEAVRRPLPPASPSAQGFTLQEQLERDVREEAGKELAARNRRRDELLTAAAQLRTQGAAIAGQLTAVLVEHVADVGTADEEHRAATAYARALHLVADFGYAVGIRPDDPGDDA